MKILTIGFALLASGFIGLASAPAAAQNTSSSDIPFNGTSCPAGFERGSYRTPSRNNTNICYDRRSDAARSNVSVTKPVRLDRCPLGYFTSDADPMACASRLASPPTIRVKGSGPCRAGEVEDWGIWCVSNYANLTRGQAATALRDWNAIYTLNRGTPPRQADLPEGSQYTPAYFTIFGRVKEDGTPIGGGSAAAAPAATPARNTASVPAAPQRTGTMTPQRRNLSSFNTCPNGWFQGMAGQRELPDPNMCYPGPTATPIYSVPSQESECSQGYWNSMSWCVGMPGTTASAQSSQQAAATPNCPAPASGAAAQQLGSQLGGLLGGRRNGQAGAALGGLLGAAAGSQANKPAGCP